MPALPWSVSDISIMSPRIEEHRFRTVKSDEDRDMTYDENEESEIYLHWAVLDDKGYQGGRELFLCIVLYKKPPRGTLRFTHDRLNKKLSSDRIILESGTQWLSSTDVRRSFTIVLSACALSWLTLLLRTVYVSGGIAIWTILTWSGTIRSASVLIIRCCIKAVVMNAFNSGSVKLLLK